MYFINCSSESAATSATAGVLAACWCGAFRCVANTMPQSSQELMSQQTRPRFRLGNSQRSYKTHLKVYRPQVACWVVTFTAVQKTGNMCGRVTRRKLLLSESNMAAWLRFVTLQGKRTTGQSSLDGRNQSGKYGKNHSGEGVMTRAFVAASCSQSQPWSPLYQHILKPNVKPSVPQLKFGCNRIMQQDKDNERSRKCTTDWLEDRQGAAMAQSPDLEPIEMLWGYLWRGVQKT